MNQRDYRDLVLCMLTTHASTFLGGGAPLVLPMNPGEPMTIGTRVVTANVPNFGTAGSFALPPDHYGICIVKGTVTHVLSVHNSFTWVGSQNGGYSQSNIRQGAWDLTAAVRNHERVMELREGNWEKIAPSLRVQVVSPDTIHPKAAFWPWGDLLVSPVIDYGEGLFRILQDQLPAGASMKQLIMQGIDNMKNIEGRDFKLKPLEPRVTGLPMPVYTATGVREEYMASMALLIDSLVLPPVPVHEQLLAMPHRGRLYLMNGGNLENEARFAAWTQRLYEHSPEFPLSPRVYHWERGTLKAQRPGFVHDMADGPDANVIDLGDGVMLILL